MTATKTPAKGTAKKPAVKPRPAKRQENAGVVTSVPLADLDLTPARSVRASAPDPEHVARLVAAYETNDQPDEPQAFGYRAGGKAKYLLADGGHRIAAHVAANVRKADCFVEWCDSKEDAVRKAFAFAFRANYKNGQPRSNADLQAAVRAALARPEYAKLSDTKIDELCMASRGYTSKLKRGDRQGADPAPDLDLGAEVPRGDDAEADRPDAPPAADSKPVAESPEVPIDAKGTPIPEYLLGVFADREVFRDADRTIRNGLGLAEDLAREASGSGLAASIDSMKLDLKHKVLEPLRLSAPYVVCPAGAAGEPHANNCPHCDGREWLTKLRYSQLPAGLKAKCGPAAGDQE